MRWLCFVLFSLCRGFYSSGRSLAATTWQESLFNALDWMQFLLLASLPLMLGKTKGLALFMGQEPTVGKHRAGSPWWRYVDRGLGVVQDLFYVIGLPMQLSSTMAFGQAGRGQQHGDSSDAVSTPLACLTSQMLSLKEFKWHNLMQRKGKQLLS